MKEPNLIKATREAMISAGGNSDQINAIPGEQLFNAFTKSLPAPYDRSVDMATRGFTNIVGIGQQILADEDLANAWISNLINRIGLVLFHQIEAENPLRVFKKGLMPNGRLIEEVALDAATGYRFNPSIAEKELFTRVKPKVSMLIHTADRNMTYPATFQDNYLNDAFTSFEQLDQFVTSQIQSMVNGNMDDEYYDTKLLLSNAYSMGAVVQSEMDMSVIKNVQKDILENMRLMAINNRNFNRAFGANQPGILQRTMPKDLVVIMDVKTSVSLDVDFWANVFQVTRAEAGARMVIIDKFEDVYKYNKDHTVVQADLDGTDPALDPREWKVGDIVKAGAFAKVPAGNPTPADITKVVDGSKIHYWLGDKDAIQIWDRKIPKIKTTENPMGMYVNAFLQVREIISYSQIAQSVIGVEQGYTPTPINPSPAGDAVETA